MERILKWFEGLPTWAKVLMGLTLVIPLIIVAGVTLSIIAPGRRGSTNSSSLSGAIDATGQIRSVNKVDAAIVDRLEDTNKRVEGAVSDITKSVDKLSDTNESIERDAANGLDAIGQARKILESAPRRKRKTDSGS